MTDLDMIIGMLERMREGSEKKLTGKIPYDEWNQGWFRMSLEFNNGELIISEKY